LALPGLQVLRKPLRPLWVGQSSRLSDQPAQPADLPFTPIYLVSASLPSVHERRQCMPSSGAGWVHGC